MISEIMRSPALAAATYVVELQLLTAPGVPRSPLPYVLVPKHQPPAESLSVEDIVRELNEAPAVTVYAAFQETESKVVPENAILRLSLLNILRLE